MGLMKDLSPAFAAFTPTSPAWLCCAVMATDSIVSLALTWWGSPQAPAPCQARCT